MYVKYQMPLIAVSDVGRSKRFYCGLFDQRVVLDFGENVTFSGGFAIQEKFAWLTGLAEDSVRSRPNNMELYFETDDLDAFMQRLGEWPDPVELLHPPHKYGWQQCTVRFYDPDGHIIEVGEAMEVVKALPCRGTHGRGDRRAHPASPRIRAPRPGRSGEIAPHTPANSPALSGRRRQQRQCDDTEQDRHSGKRSAPPKKRHRANAWCLIHVRSRTRPPRYLGPWNIPGGGPPGPPGPMRRDPEGCATPS